MYYFELLNGEIRIFRLGKYEDVDISIKDYDPMLDDLKRAASTYDKENGYG